MMTKLDRLIAELCPSGVECIDLKSCLIRTKELNNDRARSI